MKMRHLPPNHDIGRVMASLHPQNARQGMFEQKSCVLVVTLLLGGGNILGREDIFVPVLGVPLEETLCYYELLYQLDAIFIV
jgi:hypothetical protein